MAKAVSSSNEGGIKKGFNLKRMREVLTRIMRNGVITQNDCKLLDQLSGTILTEAERDFLIKTYSQKEALNSFRRLVAKYNRRNVVAVRPFPLGEETFEVKKGNCLLYTFAATICLVIVLWTNRQQKIGAISHLMPSDAIDILVSRILSNMKELGANKITALIAGCAVTHHGSPLVSDAVLKLARRSLARRGKELGLSVKIANHPELTNKVIDHIAVELSSGKVSYFITDSKQVIHTPGELSLH